MYVAYSEKILPESHSGEMRAEFNLMPYFSIAYIFMMVYA